MMKVIMLSDFTMNVMAPKLEIWNSKLEIEMKTKTNSSFEKSGKTLATTSQGQGREY